MALGPLLLVLANLLRKAEDPPILNASNRAAGVEDEKPSCLYNPACPLTCVGRHREVRTLSPRRSCPAEPVND